jgi:DNA repair exonuclease SbcCD ATPase subunit
LLKEGKIPKVAISSASAASDNAPQTATPSSLSKSTDDKIKKFLAAQAAFKKEKDQGKMSLKELEATRTRSYQQIFSGANELSNNTNAFSQNDIQHFRQQQAELDRLQKEFRQQNEEVNQRIDQLEQEADKLQKDLDYLKSQQSQVQSVIKNVAEQGSKLAEQIEATRQKIEEINRRSERLKRALTAAAFVGACIFTTWALGFALEGTSVGAMIAPTQGGGVFVGATVTI